MLLAWFEHDLCFRTLSLLAVSFGLRISELRGLKCCDVDWLGKTLRIERGVVKQIVDDVKSSHSARTMAIADELLEVLKLWRQTTPFAAVEDWMFASPMKLGRQPISYTFIWEFRGNSGRRPTKTHAPLRCPNNAEPLWRRVHKGYAAGAR